MKPFLTACLVIPPSLPLWLQCEWQPLTEVNKKSYSVFGCDDALFKASNQEMINWLNTRPTKNLVHDLDVSKHTIQEAKTSTKPQFVVCFWRQWFGSHVWIWPQTRLELCKLWKTLLGLKLSKNKLSFCYQNKLHPVCIILTWHTITWLTIIERFNIIRWEKVFSWNWCYWKWCEQIKLDEY